MYAVEKLSSYITRGVYTVSGPFHPFGGAVDIIVVQQQDGSFKSSPWYVRFGKFQGVLKTREKVVTIYVNGVEAGFHMYLDPRGEAYFLRDCDSDEGGDFELSPPSSSDEMDENIRSVRFKKVQSCNYDGGQGEPIMPLDNGNGKIVSRTNSQRSRIFGLMFGYKSIKESNQGGNVGRASSLERAEIAANLLETKWSTNLRSSYHRTDNAVEKHDFDASISNNEMITSHEEGSDDNFGTGTVSREHSEVAIRNSPTAATNFIGDDTNPSLTTDDSVKKSVGSHGEKLGDISRPNMVQEVHFEETITQSSTSRTHEEVLEVYTLESGDLGDRSTLVSESAMIESDDYNVSSKGFILNNTTDDAQHPGSMEDALEVALPEEKYDGEKEVSSLTYTETLQNSTVTFDVSIETHNTLNLSSGGDEPLQQSSDLTRNTREYICEVSSRPELENATDGENYSGCDNQNLELSRVEVSSISPDSQAHSPCKAAFNDICLNAESPQKSCSSESEVIYQDREAIEISQGKISGTEPVDLTENRCQIIEEEALAPICHVPVTSDISSITYEGLGNDTSGEKPCLQNRLEIAQDDSTLPLSESLEDEQFQFSDIKSFSVKQINPEIQASNEAVETDDRMLLKVEGDMEEHESEDTNHEECFESLIGSQTSPLAIPRSTTQFGETELLTKSLPIIRSQIHDLERSNLLHPLSCSLDLNLKSYEQDMLNKDISSSSKLESDSGRKAIRDTHSSQDAVTVVDSEIKQSHDVSPNYSTVELSLCKHLLFDNMGVDSASRVFEANKVNLEKFSALGPSLVKNDKLVVRIGRRYLPWDEAAPIILGMLCFGQEQVFEPQGMIVVDRDEKNFNGDPSGAMVPSAGSWRLWPFSLRKSKTLSTVRSVPESTTQENEDVVQVRSQSLMGQRAKFKKKKVRSLTPTSEELASLNLKEGRNVITFSFSTAMLGQQQVDARIYLWKWNTRIVISDVDGTITKSDVLGQFMPLVGKDWSQTGVAHLFSAIKENGYQFLFLSARAIAQAYITRQFLFNLKQDGKALPDGPVVISPDGLFPSLFREVIRRAPHEFKIACLEDIRALFPSECNPFYAGFGNRDTDEISYLKVGVPKSKIFIVNPKGEVAVNRRVNSKSYTSLYALVNGMFPPMSTAEQEDFNSWNYWKLPLPGVDI